MRIAISGSHSLGKSTFVQDFIKSHAEYVYEKEPYRALRDRYEIKFAEEQTCHHIQLQLDYCIERVKLYSPNANVMFDRSPADFIPYSEYSVHYGRADINQDFVNSLYPKIIEVLGYLDLIVFIPISADHPIDLEDDGVRPTHDFYREWVDNAFKTLYRENLETILPKKSPFKLVEIVGTRQERLKRLDEMMKACSKR